MENGNFIRASRSTVTLHKPFSVLLEEANTAGHRDSQPKAQLISRGAKLDRTVTGEGLWRATGQNTTGLVLALQ